MKKSFLIIGLFWAIQSLQAQTCEQAVETLNQYYQTIVTKHQEAKISIQNISIYRKDKQEKNLQIWYDKQMHYCLQQVKTLAKLCPSTLWLKTEAQEEDPLAQITVAPEEAKKTIRFEIPKTPKGFDNH